MAGMGMGVMLLVKTAQDEVVAVMFPSVDGAREWEDAHEDQLDTVGVARVVTRAEALGGTH